MDPRHGFREKLKCGMVVISNRTIRMTQREALTLDAQVGFVLKKNMNELQSRTARLAVTGRDEDDDYWRESVVESCE